MATAKEQLDEIRQQIKSGKRKQALTQLVTLIERDHSNPELWWLLANATDDVHQAHRALEEMQSLAPDDPRAEKMLRRLETRRLLSHMGVRRDGDTSNRKRILALSGVAVVVATVVIVGAVFAINAANQNSTQTANLPTQEAAEPTDETAAVTTPETTEAATGTDAPPTPTVAPTNTEVIIPTQEEAVIDQPVIEGEQPGTTGNNVQTRGDAGSALPPDPVLSGVSPESTAEAVPGVNVPPASMTTSAPQSAPRQAAAPVADVRGQITSEQSRRELIQPYGEHGWTFSGYRGEEITLEVVTVSGRGNPSLELRNANDEIIQEDIDTTSGDNTDARLAVVLPADGVYTVVVRMAAVEEQFYLLTLRRGDETVGEQQPTLPPAQQPTPAQALPNQPVPGQPVPGQPVPTATPFGL